MLHMTVVLLFFLIIVVIIATLTLYSQKTHKRYTTNQGEFSLNKHIILKREYYQKNKSNLPK